MDSKLEELDQVEQPRKAIIPDVQIIPCTPEIVKCSDRSNLSDEDKLKPQTPEMPECVKSFNYRDEELSEWNKLTTPPKPKCLIDDDEL
jgi:hypothetical protein